MIVERAGGRRPPRWTPRLEATVALVLLTGCLLAAPYRFIFRVWAGIGFDALAALPTLLRDDGQATLPLFATAVFRIALVLLPPIVLLRQLPWHRRLLVAPLLMPMVIAGTTLSLIAGRDVPFFVLVPLALVVLSVRRLPWLRWAALLPLLSFWLAAYRHEFSHIFETGPAAREQRLAICRERGAALPANLSAELIRPYFGVSRYSDDLLLLTGPGQDDGDGFWMSGEGGPRLHSWWMRRRADGRLEFEAPSRATGNLWRGCMLGDTLWMSRANRLIGTAPLPPGSAATERMSYVVLPSRDTDFGENACDVSGGRLYAGEAFAGGIWEVDPRRAAAPHAGDVASDGVLRHPVDGFILMLMERPDGKIVVHSTAEIIVFDPVAGRVQERLAASLAGFGVAVCQTDGAVAKPDATGRVRVYAIDGEGRYRFDWGLSLFSPRRVAFSPDCSRLAVTSFDDTTVSFIDVASRRVVATHTAGPALREVTATGPREFSVADICSMTTYTW